MRLRPANGPDGREFPETDASIRKNRELDVRLTDVARVSGKGSARGRSPWLYRERRRRGYAKTRQTMATEAAVSAHPPIVRCD